MKMVLTSGVFSIVIGVVAYYILINMGMDSANVMSSINVRLQYLKSTKRIKKNDKNKPTDDMVLELKTLLAQNKINIKEFTNNFGKKFVEDMSYKDVLDQIEALK